jgi:hypothetical protein
VRCQPDRIALTPVVKNWAKKSNLNVARPGPSPERRQIQLRATLPESTGGYVALTGQSTLYGLLVTKRSIDRATSSLCVAPSNSRAQLAPCLSCHSHLSHGTAAVRHTTEQVAVLPGCSPHRPVLFCHAISGVSLSTPSSSSSTPHPFFPRTLPMCGTRNRANMFELPKQIKKGNTLACFLLSSRNG